MTIRVTCSGCGSTLKIKDDLAGKDGTCPKCKAAIHIPKAKPAADADNGGLPQKSEADADEEDMFGKDFFKVQEASSRPRFTTANYDDDDDEDEKPKSKAAKKPSTDKPEPPKAMTPAFATATDAAANMAGQLLSKTGKKNRNAEADEANAAEEKADYTELKYLLTRKVLPIVGGGIVGVFLIFLLSKSMFAGKSTRPPLGYVIGVCTIAGQPADKAEIRFYPKAKSPTEPAIGSFSYAICEADGSYVLRYDSETEGAVVGKHLVSVTHMGRMLEQEQDVAAGNNSKPIKFD